MNSNDRATVSITFSTIGGRENLLMTVEEALKTEVAPQVRSVLERRAEGVVGAQFNLPFFGRVNIDIID